eukprot:9496051-Pyramimonas_sp.AAC.1
MCHGEVLTELPEFSLLLVISPLCRIAIPSGDGAACTIVCHFVKNEIASRVANTGVEVGVDAGVAGAGVRGVG